VSGRGLLRVLIVASLAAPAAAQAAPVDIGAGRDAHVAVDAAGAAHVAFSENVSGQDVSHVCVLPSASSTTCVAATFSYPLGANFGSSSGTWPLLPGDGRLLVLDSRCCQNYSTKYVHTSTDGGQSFDAGTEVGDDDNSGSNVMGAALYAPAGAVGRPAESIFTITDLATLGLSFQAAGTTGPPATTTPNSVLTPGNDHDGSLGRSGNTLVAAWSHIADGIISWRQWTGAGDVNDSANWSPTGAVDTGGVNAAPQLTSGPSGIYIAYNTGSSSPLPTVVRKFTGSGWGPPLTINDAGDPRFDIVEGPDGTLHYVWVDGEALRYEFANGPDNSSFSGPQTLVEDNSANGGYTNLRLGVSADTAWVTWEDSSPVHVKALPFKPSTLPAPERGTSVNVVPTKGKVLVKLPAGASGAAAGSAAGKAGSGFVPLESLGRQVPVGSTLDTSKGTVRLFSAANSSGSKTQRGDFTSGRFIVGQGRKNPLTTVSMTGAGLGKCSKLPPGGSPKQTAGSAKRKRRRSLFSNVHGHFRTRGRNSAATVSGTKFTMTDTCKGTRTTVKSGSVRVRDFWLRKTHTVKAGHSYFARRGNR
jgi:hypothetical protein